MAQPSFRQHNYMLEVPDAVMQFEEYLKSKGLRRQRREKRPSFGDTFIQYADNSVAVRIFSERGIWFVDISDVAGRPQEWYDAGIIRDLIVGHEKDGMPLADQIEVFTHNWDAILDRFAPPQREKTYSRLATLEQERAKRMFPGLIS